MKKMNKKGMTLVECIIAMGVFAIATTGFTMAASTCMKAQVKYHNRNRTTNTQTTNLEHFSNYTSVVDLNELNVTPMDPDTGIGKNMYQVTFDFGSGLVVENRKVHGYRAAVGDNQDGVYELSFLSPIEQVSLEDNEYWITLYNCSDADMTWDISTRDPNLVFFDNEKVELGTDLERHIWSAGGEYKRFGVRDNGAASLTIYISAPMVGTESSVDISQMINVTDEEDRYGFIYFTGGNSFLNTDNYNP